MKDPDIRHYIHMSIFGIVAFAGIAITLLIVFRSNYAIYLSQSTIEYGDNVAFVDLVEAIGEEPVKNENRISENTIQMEEYEVTFEGYDPSVLGEQEIIAQFSDDEISDEKVKITIQDTTAPKIKIKVDEPVTMKLEDVQKKKFDSFFSVSDNYTSSAKIKIKAYIKEDTYTYEDTVNLVIEATDSNENQSQKTIEIHIEPEPEPEPEPEEKEEAESSEESQKTNSEQSSSSSVQEQQPAQSQQQTQTPSQNVTKPSNRQFLFSDGYNMGNVQSACSAALNSSGHSGACIPLQDSNGIYYGMELVFY